MPFPQNTPSIDDLIALPAHEIAKLPVATLLDLQTEVETATQHLKAVTTRFHAALELRYAARAAETRRSSGKDTGSTRFTDGEAVVVADQPKRVVWEQAALAAIIERIRASGDDPRDYVETTLKVAERNYMAWPQHIRAAFEPARTVRTGAPSFRLIASDINGGRDTT